MVRPMSYFKPLDFISRLVSLVPKPRVNLTRFHGVFAPNSKYRVTVTPARRGKHEKSYSADEADQSTAEKRASMTWAKRLKRVFSIEMETCSECGGDVRIIALYDHRDVGGRAMQGAIAEKIR